MATNKKKNYRTANNQSAASIIQNLNRNNNYQPLYSYYSYPIVDESNVNLPSNIQKESRVARRTNTNTSTNNNNFTNVGPNAPYGNASGGGRGNYVDNSIPTFNITYEPPSTSTITPTLSPISYNPTDPSSYGWDTGATLLAGYGNEAPSTRNIVYNNEFSPESTMSMANDIYNEYYAPMVQQQQEMNTRDYQRAANRSIASVESDRAQIQLQNQAAREATAANTLYQQQQQAAAFQQTLDARNLELQNKIQDYENAWEEVATYGYVVTENTANLLGIDPRSTAYNTSI